ncbi:hypothetical protein [Agrococcus jejuensis]|uniref:Flagellar protein FlgN n=1 Tax=Agrococcus jejuensis TaxID=399736 RepID=A0A1G8BTU1_9MICO|nr:hypothetical protein [Agrococcus jejuensis]SDH36499.1 hypothetical protein SAMN04489720_1050 [Agrococcus jejuensis]
MDVLVKFEDLRTLNEYLVTIVGEFDAAEGRADRLEEAIGDPFGRDRLREAVEDFEDRWDDKRDELRDDLKKVQEHVQGVLDGFTDWDVETAKGMEG